MKLILMHLEDLNLKKTIAHEALGQLPGFNHAKERRADHLPKDTQTKNVLQSYPLHSEEELRT
jgi:hypothetical protein